MTNSPEITALSNEAEIKQNFEQALSSYLTNIADFLGTGTEDEKETKTIVENILGTLWTHEDPSIQEFLEKVETLFPERKKFLTFLATLEKTTLEEEYKNANRMMRNFNHKFTQITENVRDRKIREIFHHLREHEHGSLEIRYQAALEMETRLRQIVTEQHFTTNDIDRTRVTPDNVMSICGYITEILPPSPPSSNSSLLVVVEKIKAIKNEYELKKNIGTIDREKLERNRMEYGAKGANLIAIQELLAALSGLEEVGAFKSLGEELSIPDFQLVPASLYRRWKSGEDISGELKNIHETVTRGGLMVRSSAVFSEDGENTTGAGIYNSIMMDENHDFGAFQKAVEKVYESCDTEEAKKYQKVNGVDYEEMGLVIQTGISGKEKGYMNSTKPYMSKITDIHYDQMGYTLGFKKHELDQLITLRYIDFHTLVETHQVKIDYERMSDTTKNSLGEFLVIGKILEMHYGHPVQVEFITKKDNKSRERKKYLLQVRPLPAKMFVERKVEFPPETPMTELEAMGIGDMELEILPTTMKVSMMYESEIDNSEKTGVAIFHSSHLGSDYLDQIQRECPKYGAVVILTQSREGEGHIETIAMEKGLMLLFNNRGGYVVERFAGIQRIMNHIQTQTISVTGGFMPGRKLRIVADGMAGRIYAIPEKE